MSDKKLLGKLAKELSDQDVLAMGMVRLPLCTICYLNNSFVATSRSLLGIHHSAIFSQMMNGEISSTTSMCDIIT